ncbi:hypothetical protein PP348_20285 [Mycobacteroides abscessus]|uniref:hypothetical protein n=1 Tax=Mycobacteroides abscessus TaxID=36809 RepID=UPI0021030725|nr:hypothetical protein [Mycobacteroides abscessus]MDM2096415.1 hypothetical protein [Mycobacteroides abscessus]MDM2121146.1 hypothetical protein [Mycobacteroides abscessus]MDM2124359.1 hypothetical protein [Mycobacteroides abscessus]MDM2130544.1 hypothetical protein [Mycobacteroides abscessus]MDM2203067.1 hypothetical protein [Mycobacteroides abscessus]
MLSDSKFRRSPSSAATVLVVSCALFGCGAHPSGNALAHAEQVAASCPTDGRRIAAYVASDESGTGRGETAGTARQQVIRDAAERTAICGGHLRVTAFSGSMIGVTVFDGDLQLDGATTNARLRKAPKVVDAVMEELNATLPESATQLTDGATDIVGQYQHAAEYIAQLATSGQYQLELSILTDGIQTAGSDLGDLALTPEQATALATGFVVPELPGATVHLIGIGRQADNAPLPTPYIAALRAFHTAVCERTHGTCTVVTDAAGA